MTPQKVDHATLAGLVEELYAALKTYCPCNITKGTDKKAFCSKCRTGNALKKAKVEGVCNEKD